MGNELCNHDPSNTLQTSTNTKIIQNPTPSIIAPEVIKLQCDICGQERQSTKLKDHIDICHFASILEKTPIEEDITCLLCDLKSGNLEQHKNHLRYRHPYMDGVTRKNSAAEKNNEQRETNEKIKKRVRMLAKNEFSANSDGTVQIRNQKYNVKTVSKEYNAMEFYEDNATGDLVWKQIFDTLQDAYFYNIEFTAQQKNILAVAKIFTKASSSSPIKRANA